VERKRSYDEVSALASTLNGLVAKLQHRQAELEELNLTLEQRVDERTQALAEALDVVRQNEQRIHTIIESAQDAFIGMGLDGRVIDWNSAAEQMFGWRREDALGRPMGELVFPKSFHLKSLRQFRETGQLAVLNQRVERVVCDHQGRELQVEMTARLAGGADTSFFSIFMRDIALRKKVEQMKNELVATVSHELRTPLTSMRASLSLLTTGAVAGVPEEAAELIAIAHRHCERLVRLVNDMLDVQKIESGQVQLVRNEQPLLPILNDAASAMRGHAGETGVRIECSLDAAAAQLRAEVDADRLTQVLTNLLSNAIKFSPPGGTVELRLVRHGDGLRISVLDRGPGIPQDFRERIFQRFAQSDTEAARRQGSGLGLNISRNIILEHGGELGFRDREGGGTEFFVDLPLDSRVGEKIS
jgi:PAS domain S-box-containing protein